MEPKAVTPQKPNEKSLGQVAYESYVRQYIPQQGEKILIPNWDMLPDDLKNKWHLVAESVVKAFAANK